MMRRYNRLLALFFVATDAIISAVSFAFSYMLRFHWLAGVVPVTKGYPPFEYYVKLLPFVMVILPIAFHIQGLYHLRRGRSRVDDFFAVFVGSILAVVFGVGGTLYYNTYFVPDPLKDAGVYEVSQVVWALYLVINVVLAYASREIVREALERRWKAGIGLKRVLIAGASDLGKLVADKVLEHRELGFKVVGFLDDRAAGDHIGYRGLPLLGTLGEADEIIRQENIDHVYVALPLEEHVKMLAIVEATNREAVEVHVVPDLLQFIALRARLENLDGVPIISLNDVPLRGFNSILKRAIDACISAGALLGLSIPSESSPRSSSTRRRDRFSTSRSAWASMAKRSRCTSSVRCTPAQRTKPARSGRETTILGAPRSGGGCGAWISTNCLSSGTYCAATCRSWARGRNAPTSSSSSSTGFRNTCCATR